MAYGDVDDGKSTAISRRRFVEVSVGALASLHAMAGGFALPFAPSVALAAEGDSATTPSAHIVVVSPTEAGFVVQDVSRDGHPPVKNAKVTLVSRYNGKTASATTDASGRAVIDIKDLAAETTTGSGKRQYAFNGSLSIEADGYRSFATGILRVEGGDAKSVPTQPLKGGEPYPKRVTFDNWDALYTSNEFMNSPDNDVSHTVRAELVGVGAGTQVKLVSSDGKTTYATASTREGENGASVADISGALLHGGEANALPANGGFAIAWSSGDADYRAPLALNVLAADKGTTTQQKSVGRTLQPFNRLNTFTKITIPNDIPIIGGAVFTPWIPQLPVNVSFDPFGFLIITWNVNGDPYGIRSDDESSVDEGWKKYPRGSAAEQFNKLEKDMSEMSGKYADAASRKGFVNQVNFSQLLSASVNVQLLAGLRWEKGVMEGLLGLQAALSVGYTLSENFTVGPVPVLVEFGFDMSAIISLSCGVVKPADAALDEFSKYTFDYSNSGVTFTLLFSPRLSVGIGVKGVASISLQGVFGISLFYSITNPRIVMGLMAKAQVVVQFILFSAAFPLWSWNDPSFIDSAKEASNQLQAQANGSGSNDYAGHTLADLFGELKIIPESALAETAEHEREGAAPQPNYALGEPQALGGDLKAVSIQAASASAGTGGGHSEHAGEGGALVAASLQLTTGGTAPADGSTRRFIPFVHLDVDGNATPVSHRVGDAKPDSPENGLTAQAKSDPAKPGVTVPSFKALNTASAENGALPSASVHSLADSGSLVPSSDMKLAESVLSNPRTKTIVLDFTTYALRIATVMVAGQPRTRVIMDQVSGSRKTVAVFDVPFNHSDFKTMPSWQGATQGLNHDDYFDYDFDVDFEGPLYDLDDPGTDIVYWIHLFIISGKRAQDDKTGVALAATDQVFSYVRAKYSIYYGLLGSEMYTMNARDAGLRASEGAYHSYSCPHIDTFADPRLSRYTAVWDDPIVGVRMFYLDRYGDTPEAALSTQTGSHAAVSWFAAFSDGIFLPSADDLAKLNFDDARCTQMQVDTIPYRGGVWHQVALRMGDELAYYLARIDFGAKDPGASELSFDNLTLDIEAVKCDAVNSHMRMMPWRKSDIERPHMLAVIPDGQGLSKVCEAKWTDAGTPELSLTELGPTNVAAQSIGVSPDGQWLYFPAQRDGSPGFDYSEAGSGTQKPEVSEHTIMACRRFGDRFSDAFPFAQVEHAMDELVGLGDTDGSAAMSFISTEITDAASGRANLWYTSMPHVRSAIVVSCECTEELVGADTDATFRVAFRNVGNVYLKSVKVSIAESGGDAEITFSSQTLCDSHYNPNGDGARDDGLLAPGKTSIYLATLHIPSDWEGAHDVTLSVTDATEATASANGGLSAQANSASEAVLFTPPAANGPHDRVVVQAKDEASSEKLNPSDVIASSGADAGGDDAGRGDSAPTRGAPARSGLPGTGDSTPALLGVAAAAAVMAGAAAWKANRMANKASEAESESENPGEARDNG